MSLFSLFLSLTLVMVRQMTDGERWRAIGMLDAGMSIRDVARTVGRSHIRPLESCSSKHELQAVFHTPAAAAHVDVALTYEQIDG